MIFLVLHPTTFAPKNLLLLLLDRDGCMCAHALLFQLEVANQLASQPASLDWSAPFSQFSSQTQTDRQTRRLADSCRLLHISLDFHFSPSTTSRPGPDFSNPSIKILIMPSCFLPGKGGGGGRCRCSGSSSNLHCTNTHTRLSFGQEGRRHSSSSTTTTPTTTPFYGISWHRHYVQRT